MATVNFSIYKGKDANEFRYPANNKEKFREMRYFLLAACTTIQHPFIGKLVNAIDDFADLKPGEERYFTCSAYDVICKPTLAEFNQSAGLWWEYSTQGETYRNYCPAVTGYRIRRTNKLFIIHNIFDD